jgi:hypothetical protein
MSRYDFHKFRPQEWSRSTNSRFLRRWLGEIAVFAWVNWGLRLGPAGGLSWLKAAMLSLETTPIPLLASLDLSIKTDCGKGKQKVE